MNFVSHDPKVKSLKVTKRVGSIIEVDPDAPRQKYYEVDSRQWWRGGTKPRRDSFRQRCYDAENNVINRVEQRKFVNVTEVAKFVRDFIEKPWFQRRFPRFESCQVSYRPGSKSCEAYPVQLFLAGEEMEVVTGSMHLSSWGMGASNGNGGAIVILHELAHAVLPPSHWHDRRWCRTFVDFVGVGSSQETRKDLMQELKYRRVSYSPFKKVNFTEEHMQRLAAARPNPRKVAHV